MEGALALWHLRLRDQHVNQFDRRTAMDRGSRLRGQFHRVGRSLPRCHSPVDKAKRKIAPTRSTRAQVLFTGIAGAVVLTISAGTIPWGYSPAWGLAAASLFVPSILAFLVIRPRTKKSDAGEAPPATSPSQ